MLLDFRLQKGFHLKVGSKENFCTHYFLRLQIANKLASLEAVLVRNSADLINDLLTSVECRATSVDKNES